MAAVCQVVEVVLQPECLRADVERGIVDKDKRRAAERVTERSQDVHVMKQS